MLARAAWRAAQPGWDVRRLVFIDETGLNTKMTRRYGRSRVGQRCPGAVPHGHWHSSTFLAALRHDRLTAPFFLEGALDSDAFTAYLRHVLCPELHPGDIVIMDNLSTHKVAAVATLIEAVGAEVRYLPAYSPDLNPIELAFSKLKAHLRQAAARNLDDLLAALAHAINRFTSDQCQGFFKHAKYATT